MPLPSPADVSEAQFEAVMRALNNLDAGLWSRGGVKNREIVAAIARALYAAVPVAQLVEAGEPKSDTVYLTSASGGDDLQTALPSAYINAAGISASDMPHTVVRKLDEAAIRKRPPPPALTDAQIAEMADRYGTGRAQGDNDFARAVERATLESMRMVPIAGPSSEPLLKDKKDSESMTSSPPSVPLIAQPAQEPVAWRMVTPVNENVVFLETRAEAERFASMDDREITPLYAAPAPSQREVLDHVRAALYELTTGQARSGYVTRAIGHLNAAVMSAGKTGEPK